MLIDTTLVLSNAQAVAATCASEHIVDQGAAGHAGLNALVMAQVNETFAGLTDLTISLQTAETADFSAPKELASVHVAGEELKEGKVLLKMALPLQTQRYIRGYYTASGTGTAGKLSLFITGKADL